ncbi:hypothetical protein ACFPOA_02355 [Lysobacter niabensis]|uniref:hypothetical protein n=1 Tax=Agrilutibacter niabensis TaxID=380628 RepID=UPI00361AEA07
MRRPVVVLAIAIAMLALPSTPRAQQREEASATTIANRATDGSASDPAARKSPKSLMGMMMATLIDSAQRSESTQQSERQPAAQPPAASAARTPTPTTDTATADAQVAVQTVP